jgi:signal transduction histidine kinase
LQARLGLLRKYLAGDGKAEERINKLEEVAASMEQLLTDFLTFARPAGNDLEETDPVSLVRQVLEFEELELERSGVRVNFHSDAEVPAALVDRGKLKRALLNLVVNARQAMPDGGELHVRVLRRRARVRIEIQDSGHGIPPEDQRRIFQTYFTTKSGGTGLGLAIVRRTIEDFGGTISFTSTVGRGTTFIISLPSMKQHRATVKRSLKELAR